MSKWKDRIGGKPLHPESLMMSYGYKPEWSEGAAKSPIFQTSTFVFRSAEEGAAFFELASGNGSRGPGSSAGLIYSRLNNPDVEIAEDRLALWDGAEDCALFNSGMAAIATTLLAYLRPGDVVAVSHPLYGGTHHLTDSVLPQFGIRSVTFGCACPRGGDRGPPRRRRGAAGDGARRDPGQPHQRSHRHRLLRPHRRSSLHAGAQGAAGGGQHLPGAAVPAPPGARGRPGPLLGHQVHRGPQRPDRRGGARGGEPGGADPLLPHDAGHPDRPLDRVAADAQPGDAEGAHGTPGRVGRGGGGLPGLPPQGAAGELPGPPGARAPRSTTCTGASAWGRGR